MSKRDFLGEILRRKRQENQRRLARRDVLARQLAGATPEPRAAGAIAAIRRAPGEGPRFITEIKHASPSAGRIRPREPGGAETIARSYVGAGAAAVSVLADGPGFGGSALDVRRVARAIDAPVLFKEFVLHEVQIELARLVGASMVLLLVRALDDAELRRLIASVRAHGMEPVVEAADEAELERAIATDAILLGVNARDLRTFRLDPELAARAMERIPPDRAAIFMSGIRERADVARVAATRADAVLVGEGLMRAPDPGTKLRELRGVA